MAKEKAEKDVRQAIWDEYVENYKKESPVKAAAKEKNGELSEPPASFLGIKEVKKRADGKEIVTYR